MSVVKWIIANEPNVEHVKQIGTGGTGEVHEVSIFVILLIVQLFNKDTGKVNDSSSKDLFMIGIC